MLSGTAITNAMAADMSVPKMKGSAPKCSSTGFHSELTRKRQPNCFNARWEE